MRAGKHLSTITPNFIRRCLLPVSVASICIVAAVMVQNALNRSSGDFSFIAYGSALILFMVINHLLIVRAIDFRKTYGALNSISSGIGLGLLTYFLPDHLDPVSQLLIVFGVVAVAIVSGRSLAYLSLLLTLAVSLLLQRSSLSTMTGVIEYATPLAISIIVMEALLHSMDATHQHLHRLETINRLSRQIMLSLETEQTLSLINATFQDALEADTYFVGIVKENELHLDLFYDDGEYFHERRVPLIGTLSGWVIRNQKPLLLPDLCQEVPLEGVGLFVIGREKASLSWIGVPLKGENVNGIIALGSYTPNAFDQSDLELLSTLAEYVSLALDNTIRHAQVEEQTRLDSLTGVYNHGHFLKRLEEQAEATFSRHASLSLNMLDIDFFKEYNDSFGHLVGDRILT